ncbi:hypothetical protein [Subtercola sp. YIM 133946]|uniref:hypothetical protein n=1 Tax=Subtercola sp. YIM 133946 TaxID=3118909 RepID=UPI002F952D66
MPDHSTNCAAADADPRQEAPAREYALGDEVQTRSGRHDLTPRSGVVRERIWHYRRGEYCYYLLCGARHVSRRYFASEIEPATHVRAFVDTVRAFDRVAAMTLEQLVERYGRPDVEYRFAGHPVSKWNDLEVLTVDGTVQSLLLESQTVPTHERRLPASRVLRDARLNWMESLKSRADHIALGEQSGRSFDVEDSAEFLRLAFHSGFFVGFGDGVTVCGWRKRDDRS